MADSSRQIPIKRSGGCFGCASVRAEGIAVEGVSAEGVADRLGEGKRRFDTF
jgi:hypothetical protein